MEYKVSGDTLTTVVDLEAEACGIALKEGASLRASVRSALKRAPLDELHAPTRFRAVTLTPEDARDLMNWFQGEADGWALGGDPRGPVCARTADVIRTTLKMRGL